MSFEGDSHVCRLDARSIVGYLDQAMSPILDLNIDGGGAGIQGIFYQFLDNGSGPLYHFTGGDLGGQRV